MATFIVLLILNAGIPPATDDSGQRVSNVEPLCFIVVSHDTLLNNENFVSTVQWILMACCLAPRHSKPQSNASTYAFRAVYGVWDTTGI